MTDTQHQAVTCDKCRLVEASYWHEEPGWDEDDTYYWCLDCAPTDEEGSVAETITNGAGEEVEIAGYSCSDTCPICNE